MGPSKRHLQQRLLTAGLSMPNLTRKQTIIEIILKSYNVIHQQMSSHVLPQWNQKASLDMRLQVLTCLPATLLSSCSCPQKTLSMSRVCRAVPQATSLRARLGQPQWIGTTLESSVLAQQAELPELHRFYQNGALNGPKDSKIPRFQDSFHPSWSASIRGRPMLCSQRDPHGIFKSKPQVPMVLTSKTCYSMLLSISPWLEAK